MLLLFCLLINCIVRAHLIPKPEDSQYCAIACSAIIGRIKFEQKPAENPVCSGVLAVQSVFHCVDHYCELDDINRGLDYLNWTCTQEKRSFLSPYQLASTNNLTVINAQEAKGTRYTQIVIPSEEYYQTALGSTVTRYAATAASWNFAFGLYGFWGVVMLIGILQRIIRARPARLFPSSWPALQRVPSVPSPAFSPPGKVVTTIIIAYTTLCIIACFPAYKTYRGNIYYASERIELGKYISNRLGILTAANIPLIWLFAARNNPLLWVSGWSYPVFSQFHRWTARITALLAIAHGIGYSITNSYKKTYYVTWNESYWRWGVIALLAICVLAATSIPILLARYYDLFLIMHTACAAVGLAGVYYHHNELLERNTYHLFVWIAVAVWIAERLLRLVRITRNGYAQINTYAKLTLPEGSDMLRLDVTEHFKNSHHAPGLGQYYFIREPLRWKGWESHPFTLCSWPLSTSAPNSRLEFSKGAAIETNAHRSKESSMGYCFLISPRRGFTSRLKNLASSPASSSAISPQRVEHQGRNVRLLLEGPYPVATLALAPSGSMLLLVAGGSGISSCIPRLYQYISHENYLGVHLVWVVRSMGTFNDVREHELASLLMNEKQTRGVEISVYVTSSPASDSGQGRNTERASREADDQPQNTQTLYKTYSGRPDLDTLIKTECEKASVNFSSLSIFCCGPPSLAMRCRAATKASKSAGGGPPTEFVAHEHGW
ncbi:Ferric/cupric reductase transmembrane component 1 [Cercospora beticola]|uniref:Ferric/cupric reductase transmembrane component 1 n=1 Tax=Cercospora beticola TaxID=122368 RepID=A0A2G5HLE4_CERBT|nr:Ferric/cupric reductase transmembrane component 1 [Cercospora beticola]PIA93043.1 Ferric/cupric reductase transmembrane component 1 [Cercospora beticola]WPB01026.1 hypothetical protein RHO25_005646 [Cercospora beticola]